MNDAADLIDALGGYAQVAATIARSPGTVASWRHRKAIPVEEWPAFIIMAAEKEVPGVTADTMLALHTDWNLPSQHPSPSEGAAA